MNDMEVIKRGEIKERGKGSMCIPLPAELAKLKGVGIGDVYELCLDKGKVIIRFPKAQGEKREKTPSTGANKVITLLLPILSEMDAEGGSCAEYAQKIRRVLG